MFSKYDIVCRLCLYKKPSELVKIFEDDLDSQCRVPSLSEEIFSALGYEVTCSDSLPKYVCKECIQKMQFIHNYNSWFLEFRRHVTSIQSTINSMDFSEENLENQNGLSIKRNKAKSESLCAATAGNLPESAICDSAFLALIESFGLLIQDSRFKVINVNSCHCFNKPSVSNTSSLQRTLADRQDRNHQISFTFDARKVHDGIGYTVNLEQAANQSINLGDDLHGDLESAEYLAEQGFEETSRASGIETSRSKIGDAKSSCEPQLMCPECQISFSQKKALLKHLMSHVGAVEKYQCQFCKRKFISTSDLQRHTRAHMGLKPYVCKKCNCYFNQKNLLDSHMNWHDGQKSYLCDICGQFFSTKSNFKIHVEHIHCTLKKKPFECRVCGKSFARKHHLNNHSVLHQNSRPHQCATCGVSFKRQSQLKDHELIHSGEKPYECPQCKKAFRTSRVLNVHKLVHSGLKPHHCTGCEKTFMRRSDLQKHLKTHSNR